MGFNFDLAKPFRPFEQLMGVLPEASKDLIPLAYRVSTDCIDIPLTNGSFRFLGLDV